MVHPSNKIINTFYQAYSENCRIRFCWVYNQLRGILYDKKVLKRVQRIFAELFAFFEIIIVFQLVIFKNNAELTGFSFVSKHSLYR